MEDTSLDRFVDADETDDAASGEAVSGESGTDEPGADDAPDPAAESVEEAGAEGTTSDGQTNEGEAEGLDAVDTDAVAPAQSTADWTPGGAPCAACGTAVERRWITDGERVCADCMDW